MKYQKPIYYSMNCQQIDHILGGGVPSGIITEIAGDSGAGKTQLCVQLMSTQLRNPQNACVYIYTEGDPPIARLRQVLENRFNFTQKEVDHAQQRLFIESGIMSAQNLINCLKRLDVLIGREFGDTQVKLLVVDSIANVFRGIDENQQTYGDRSFQFFEVSSILKSIAYKYDIGVVCVNQVASKQDQKIAALGLAWSNCVNQRLLAHICEQQDEAGAIRSIEVKFSPYLANNHCYYEVRNDGIWGIDDQEFVEYLDRNNFRNKKSQLLQQNSTNQERQNYEPSIQMPSNRAQLKRQYNQIDE